MNNSTGHICHHGAFAEHENSQHGCSILTVIRRQFHAYTVNYFRSSNGTAAVEFAFIAPLFMLMLFGLIAYGIYFGAAHSVQQLTADAVRTAVAGLDDIERKEIVAQFVADNTSSYSFLDPTRIAYDSSETDGQFRVSVRYDAANLPIWNLFPGVIMPASTIHREASIRIGGL